jgi:hypothetical protein
MNKIIKGIMIFALSLSIVGCGEKKEDVKKEDTSNKEEVVNEYQELNEVTLTVGSDSLVLPSKLGEIETLKDLQPVSNNLVQLTDMLEAHSNANVAFEHIDGVGGTVVVSVNNFGDEPIVVSDAVIYKVKIADKTDMISLAGTTVGGSAKNFDAFYKENYEQNEEILDVGYHNFSTGQIEEQINDFAIQYVIITASVPMTVLGDDAEDVLDEIMTVEVEYGFMQ